MNRELLKKVKAYLREEPRRLNMGDWIIDAKNIDYERPPCGTVCCLAGATVIVSGLVKNHLDYEETNWDASKKATELLGITDSQADDLFFVNFWPLQFQIKYSQASSPAERVEVACSRVDYMMDIGI